MPTDTWAALCPQTGVTDAGTSDRLRITVVIPTRDRERSLRRALCSLSRQSVSPAEFEVVVSVDGSLDGTREMLAGFEAGFELRSVWRPQAGRAAACNAGVAVSASPLILLLDDDMEATPTLLEAHLAAHEARTVRIVLGAVPVRVGPSDSRAARYVAARFERHLAKLRQPGYRIRARDFYTGNASLPRSVLAAAGGFDESFTAYGNEDVELWARLTEKGVAVVYEPAAVAYQHYEKSVAELAADSFAKGSTVIELAERHPQLVTELRLRPDVAARRRWAVARALLLGIARRWPPLPTFAIRFVRFVERFPFVLDRLPLEALLDFCYWAGIQRTRSGIRADQIIQGGRV